MNQNRPLELKYPPIVEVVCGIVFEQIHELDAFEYAHFWDLVREQYPKRQLHSPILDGLSIQGQAGGSVMPLRAWMLSEDEDRLIQVQQNRFYLNWRAREGGQYPRFSARDGRDGLLQEAMRVFGQFEGFCSEHFPKAVNVQQIEVSKINTITCGKHWSSLSELHQVLPILESFVHDLGRFDFNIAWSEKRGGGVLIFRLLSMFDGEQPAVRLEVRHIRDSSVEMLQSHMSESNKVLNDAFFGLIPEEGRRFFEQEFVGGEE